MRDYSKEVKASTVLYDRTMNSSENLARLRHELMERVGPVVGKAASCALLDFESIANPGDAMIYRASVLLMKRCGVRIAYEADLATFDAKALRRHLPPGSTVVIAGGGQMTDIGAGRLLRFRIGLLNELREYPIVQLPESVRIGNEDLQREFVGAVRAHGSYTMFVRDKDSAARCVEMGVQPTLVPDIALLLEGTAVSPGELHPLVVIRHDAEKMQDDGAIARHFGTWRSIEWFKPLDPRAIAFYLARKLVTIPRRLGARRLADLLRPLLVSCVHVFCRSQWAKVQRVLGSASVVVSDRLHVGIACSILGVPFVMLDNSYGKVHAFFRTWMPNADDFCATTPEEAYAIAMRIAR